LRAQVDDEEHHGSDDVRGLVLATLSSANRSRVCCLLCDGQMPVYDRYPLLDGTFFLSPQQHAEHSCFKVYFEGRIQFLFAVCMGCLEGWRTRLECRACRRPWDGSSLVLGTMYFYDIFAATPCCQDRVKVRTLFLVYFVLSCLLVIRYDNGRMVQTSTNIFVCCGLKERKYWLDQIYNKFLQVK